MKRIFLGLCLFFGIIHSACSTLSYNKYWTVATIIGSLPNQTSFKYYLEPQLRLIDDVYVFNQLLLLGGLGYQFNPDTALFIGPGWIMSQRANGTLINEERIWQQLNWRLMNKPSINIMSRTRLEERKNTHLSPIAFRLRERLWIRIPFKQGGTYSWSCFDELFFNLNHPDWVSPFLIEQNRAFFGIAKQLSKSTLIDVGYLNQYLRLSTSQRDHVLLLSFTVNM